MYHIVTLPTVVSLLGVNVIKQSSQLKEFRFDGVGRIPRQHVNELSHFHLTSAVQDLQRLQMNKTYNATQANSALYPP